MIILTTLVLSLSAAAASPKAPQQLWKEWYLYSVGGEAQGFFEETVERRPGDKHLAVTQRWVEREGARVETYIGSVSTDDGKFTPVAFFSERKGGPRTYKIDGRAKSGKLTVTYKPVKPKGKDSRISIAVGKNVVLSNFVPLLLARHDPAKGPLQFTAVVEDAKDGKFDLREGSAELFGVTRKIRGETCRKARVNFEGIDGEWWVSEAGKLCELKMDANQSRLELTTEKEAKKALGD